MISTLGPETIIFESGNGDEALAMFKNDFFDVVLMDISLPGSSGLEVLEVIKTRWPSTKVLMLSMHPQEQYAIRALKIGASGYLSKDIASDELLVAIKKVADGGIYLTASLAESLALNSIASQPGRKHEILSNREFEIMIHLANGKSLKEIGNMLFISNKTVSTHRKHILEKMHLTQNTDLTRYCIENKLI
jgi:DNA-binding NarL/FixJ family response regulator